MKFFQRELAICMFLMVSLCCIGQEVMAQSASAIMIQAGKDNANKYFQSYFQPGSNSFGHALNSGWFNSAKAMGLGRFDIRIYGSVGLSSEQDRTFDLSKAGFDEHVQLDSRNTIAPSVFGRDKEGPEITILDENGKEVGGFAAPEGSGVKLAPVPVAQVNIGLIKDTELAIRFIPTIKIKDYQGNLWGVGLKHNLKQWIPVLRSAPGFNIAVVGGFTSFDTKAHVHIRPDPNATRTAEQKQAGYYETQFLYLNTKAWNAGLMISQTVGVLTGYAGVRYSESTTNIKLNGIYPITSVKRVGTKVTSEIVDIVDPINVDMSHGQYGMNAGLRLKLGFFSLFGEYTIGKYSAASAGIGLGFN